MTVSNIFASPNIALRIGISFLVVAVLPLLLISLLTYQHSEQVLNEEVMARLQAVTTNKVHQVELFFSEEQQHLSLLKQHPDIHIALKQLAEAFEEGGAESLAYNIVEETYRSLFTYLKQLFGAHDVFLISPVGDIVFSVMHEADFGTNLKTGPYKDSGFARTASQAEITNETIVSGFSRYDPSQGPAAFIATPFEDRGKFAGIIAIQLSIDELHELAEDYTNLGETGEIVLATRDEGRVEFISPLRHDPGAAFHRSVDIGSTDSLPIQSAVQGQNGSGFTIDYRGKETLAIWRYLPALELGMVVKIDKDEAFARIIKQRYWMLIVVLVVLPVVLAIALWLARYISNPISKLAHASNRLAEGDLSVEIDIDTQDEIGRLAGSFKQLVESEQEVARQAEIIATGAVSKAEMIGRGENDLLGVSMNRMIGMIKDVVAQANTIAGGDYVTEIKSRGDNDELSIALRAMTATLREVSEENRKQDWLKTTQNELNDRMRGELNIKKLAHNIITFLAECLNVQIGVLYLADEGGNFLQLVASYAYTRIDCFNARSSLGQGLAGQAAQEKKMISVSNLPPDYVRIGSAIGDGLPRNVLVVPFLHEGKLCGVIELGTFRECTETEMELLQTVTDNIAIAFFSAQARDRMQELLEQSQLQNEELEAQQEELRQTNEELEEQTEALRKSEGRLQNQQEELRAANEELEERTDALARERDAVRRKNEELELARQEIEQKAREVETASRYKSEFLANMSHELRTPLNSILILSQLLTANEGGNLTEKQLEFVSTVYSSGADLLDLINEILDISKVEAGKMELRLEEMDLDEFKTAVEQTFQQLAVDKGLSLTIKSGDGLPTAICTDSRRLMQIVKNLVANAFKFTEQGGVTVEISRPSAAASLTRSGLTPDHTVAISIIDTGIGIPTTRQGVIFEAFQQADGTTSRKYGGTGLGLAISRELAMLLGGEIQMNSKPGQGSIFTLFVPEKLEAGEEVWGLITEKIAEIRPVREEPKQAKVEPKEERQAKEPIKDDRKEIKPGDKTLLIIEDDPVFSRTLLELAHERGFQCLLAGDGESGLHFADYYKPSAIILDVGLPGIDGWVVMERLKDNPVTRHIPVHFISAIDRSMDAMKMGAIGYLTKPVTLEMLDGVFGKVEDTISRSVGKLLVVEDDAVQRQSIIELIGNGVDVETKAVADGAEAYRLMNNETFDCVILDLGLKDMSGFDLLAKIKGDAKISMTPVIVYTGKDLSQQEETELSKYAEAIIVKGVRSPERLLAETTLFLHRVEKELPEGKRKMLRMVHDKEATLQNKKILIVDDDMRNVFALASVLEEKGMQVAAARTGKEGLEKLDQTPDTDLVVMDIMMPEMDGYETIGAIRKQQRFQKLPIIALTAKAMKGDRNKCIQAGANDYLAKPIDIDKLLSLLRVWLFQ